MLPTSRSPPAPSTTLVGGAAPSAPTKQHLRPAAKFNRTPPPTTTKTLLFKKETTSHTIAAQ